MVVDCHGQGDLRLVLPDHILIQHIFDLPGSREFVGQVLQIVGCLILETVVQNAHAKMDALIADPHAGALDHPLHLIFMLAAKGAPKCLLAVVIHGITSVYCF